MAKFKVRKACQGSTIAFVVLKEKDTMTEGTTIRHTSRKTARRKRPLFRQGGLAGLQACKPAIYERLCICLAIHLQRLQGDTNVERLQLCSSTSQAAHLHTKLCCQMKRKVSLRVTSICLSVATKSCGSKSVHPLKLHLERNAAWLRLGLHGWP